jgi:hypothetical protein
MLCEFAEVPFGADYRVATQRLTLDGDFADMEIVLRDGGDQVGSLLFEHKDDPLTRGSRGNRPNTWRKPSARPRTARHACW